MRFFSNKIRVYAGENAFNLNNPIRNIEEVHNLHDPKLTDWQTDRPKLEALRHSYIEQTPPGLHPLIPTEWFPRDQQLKQKVPTQPWSYDRGVMENTYNRIKHLNPTHGEMGALSLMLRGWNRDASDPGGQYLQQMANELGGRDTHEGIRASRWGNRTPEEAQQMREGFANNPMHPRLKQMVGELQNQAQAEFAKQHGPNGTILHRGVGEDTPYLNGLGQAMDSNQDLQMNPISSYTPSLRSAMKFSGNQNASILDPEIYNKVKSQVGLPENQQEFSSYSPKYPSDWNNVKKHNLFSSHVRPEDVFLTNNVVGTPSVPYNGTNGNQDTLNKEQEVWVKPRDNMKHIFHRWTGWNSSSGYQHDNSYQNHGNAALLSSHFSRGAPNLDLDSIKNKIAHYNKYGHASSMVNANPSNVEPEP